MARARQAAHNAPAVIPPQGRLTLTTGTPVTTTDQSAKTTIYYTPYVGDRVPLYNGTEWENKVFTELSIAMAASANWAATSNFDIFVYNDAGTLRLVTGAAWTNATTRSEALTRINGILVNNATFTGRYGASSTVSIAANRATLVGTFRTTSSTGTTQHSLAGRLIANAYNTIPTTATLIDGTDVTYTTASWRYYNNNSANIIPMVFSVETAVSLSVAANTANNSVYGIGIDTSTAGGYPPPVSNQTATNSLFASTSGAPIQAPGYHFYALCEFGAAGGVCYVMTGFVQADI